MERRIRPLAGALLALLGAQPALAQPHAVARASRVPEGRKVDIVVASTTDVHGRLRGWDYYADTAESARGLSRAATIVDSVRAANLGRVILLDAGDLLQGNPLTYAAARLDTAAPHPVIAAMNAMHYDAAAVGNHEFNYGLTVLTRALVQATFPFLAANATWPAHRVWRSFTIVQRGGVRVGIVGATTPGSMVWDGENLRAGRVTVGDIIPAVRAAVKSARAAGAEVIVVVAHAGLSGAASYDTVTTGLGSENPMAQLARDVRGIDLIVYGHSHREMADTVIGGALLTQPRNWAASVSIAHLEVVRRKDTWAVTVKHASLVSAAGHGEAAAVVAAAERGHSAARRYANTVVGRTGVPWRADSARTTDTPLMDFVAETMRRASGADLASVAAFSLEVKIPAGPVTVAQLAQLYPYDNTLRALRISGAQLKAYLEQSARYFRVAGEGSAARAGLEPTIPGFNFEMVTGADYTMDISRPPADRIVGLSVRGRPVGAGDSYTIALSNYRAGGAGGYAMLNGAPVVHDKQLEIRQLLIDEVARRGSLVPADYFTPNWRLVPATLAAQAQAALGRERPFDAVSGGETRAPGTATGATPGIRAATGGRATTIRVISTTDFHGALEPRPDGALGLRGGAGQLAAYIHRAQAECVAPSCASLLLDGGDLFQGTPASNLAFGRPVVELFDLLGYAATALGNHEFDWGVDTLRARMAQARFAILGANVRYDDGRDVEWIRNDTIVERGGVRIGIIGIATTLTPTTTKASNVKGLRFDAPAPVIDAEARSLRARGAELIVVIAHAGANCNASTGCTGEIITAAENLTEPVDAIIAGHTHQVVNVVVRGIPVTEARASGRALAVTDIPLDRTRRANALHEVRVVMTDSIVPDSAAAALAWKATSSVAELVSRSIATATEAMERRGPQHALGNFIADAQRVAAHADVAVMNNGGIRANLQAGAVTYGSLFEVQPFANTLVRVTLRGSDLRTYVERLVASDAVGVHISGALVRYDPGRPAGARVVSVVVGGAPLDDARTYVLAYNDFLATGGNGLGLASVALAQEPANVVDLDALIEFARAQPGGVIRPDPTVRIARTNP